MASEIVQLFHWNPLIIPDVMDKLSNAIATETNIADLLVFGPMIEYSNWKICLLIKVPIGLLVSKQFFQLIFY